MNKHVDYKLFDEDDPLDLTSVFAEDLGNANLKGDIAAIRNYIQSELKKTSRNYTHLSKSIDKKFNILIDHINDQLKLMEKAYNKLEQAYINLNRKLNVKLETTQKEIDELTSKHHKLLSELEQRNKNFKNIIDTQEIKLSATSDTLKDREDSFVIR